MHLADSVEDTRRQRPETTYPLSRTLRIRMPGLRAPHLDNELLEARGLCKGFFAGSTEIKKTP